MRHPEECRELVDAEIMTASKGMRVDIFVNSVCHKLFLSEKMKERSELHGELGCITLRICSREDIFLLKSVTERDRDLDDMLVLLRKGIDSEVLLSECELQDRIDSKIGGRVWEAFLITKVEEMERKFDISMPWKRKLRRIADLKLGSLHVLDQINRGLKNVRELSDRLGLKPSEVRRYLAYLERADIIVMDRRTRPNIITVKSIGQDQDINERNKTCPIT